MNPTPDRDPNTGQFLPTQEPQQQPAAPAAAPAAPDPQKPAKPPEQGKVDGIKAFLSKGFVGDEGNPPPDPAAPKPAAKPKAAKPKAAPAAVAPPPALSAADIAAAAAEGVTRAMQPAKPDPAAAAAAPKADEPQFSKQQSRKLAVLARMETLFPDQYKGVAKSVEDGMRKMVKYAAEWEAKNPGKAFDEEDDEHEEFFKENNLFESWTEADYQEAMADLRADERAKQHLEPVQKKLNEFERQQKLQAEAPKITAHQIATANTFWAALGHENLIRPDGQLDPEKAKILAADPEAFESMAKHAIDVEVAAGEIYAVMNRLKPFDRSNPLHDAIDKFSAAQEQQLVEAPREDRLDEKGREFVPYAEFMKLSPDKKAKHWTMTADHLSALYAAEKSEEFQKNLAEEEEKFARMAAARGVEYKPTGRMRPEPQGQQPPPQARADAPPLEAPGADSMPISAARRSGRQRQPENGVAAFLGGIV